jgi:hypothetical protein
MNDLMVGYCILSGIICLFCLGSLFIICDMILNKEEKIVIRKPKPQATVQNNLEESVSNDYEFDDELIIN